jgi:hypothetical protein
MDAEVVNNTQLYLNEPKMALDFLVRNLGFVTHGNAVSEDADSVKICDSNGNLYEVLLTSKKNESNTNNFKLTINTNDCLQDFYIMERKGICVLTKPYYVSEGLAFEITDYWNNRYMLIEKRDYND